MTPNLIKLTLLFSVLISLASCKKDLGKPIETENPVIVVKDENYLVLKNSEELNQLLANITSPSQVEYGNWKRQHPTFESLSDRQRELTLLIEQTNDAKKIAAIMQQNADHFALDTMGRVRITSAGELISHYLNQQGLIQVGEILYKYQSGKIFYTNSEYQALSKGSATEYSGNKKIGIADIKELTKSAVAERYSQIYPPSGGEFGPTYKDNYYLISESMINNNRKFFVNLIEEFTFLMAIDNTATLHWLVGYNLFFKFGHQKRGTFGWNTWSSPTFIRDLRYTGDIPYGNSSMSLAFPRLPTSQVLVSSQITLPDGENQYYILSSIPLNNNYLFPKTSPLNVHTANLLPLTISATDNGYIGTWYEKTYYTQ